VEKSLNPSKVLALEFFEEENDDEEVFSFSTVNKYKTDIRNLKESVMKLRKDKGPSNFYSEGINPKLKYFKNEQIK
jgi:hypothetical protein